MSKNVNCLRGVACPGCGQNERFYITGVSTFDVTDDGAEQTGDIEWDEDSHCRCPQCGCIDVLGKFKKKRETRKGPAHAAPEARPDNHVRGSSASVRTA